MSSGSWTRTPPACPGWWWIVDERQVGKTRPRPVEVCRGKAGALAMGGHSLAWWRDVGGMRLLWCGPIAEPPDVLGAEVEGGEL